jgi:hypothetical protein
MRFKKKKFRKIKNGRLGGKPFIETLRLAMILLFRRRSGRLRRTQPHFTPLLLLVQTPTPSNQSQRMKQDEVPSLPGPCLSTS